MTSTLCSKRGFKLLRPRRYKGDLRLTFYEVRRRSSRERTLWNNMNRDSRSTCKL